MKVEVRCSQCGFGYLIEEDSAQGVLPCPGCSNPIALAPPVGAPARQVAPAAQVRAAPAPLPQRAATQAAVATREPAPEGIVCPRCKLHFIPRRSTSVPDKAVRRLCVLVVEDMGYFREIAADALAPKYEVKTAASVAEARSILERGGIDLLVLDLTLDGGDHGVDLLRSFSRKPCPILIYTAQDEADMYGDSWEALRQLGADDIVIKGIQVGESLLRKAGTLLGQAWDEE